MFVFLSVHMHALHNYIQLLQCYVAAFIIILRNLPKSNGKESNATGKLQGSTDIVLHV